MEFVIVAMPLLLVGLGSVELAHWFATRQVVSVALLDAGRAAITRHSHPEAIVAAFEYGLRPLYLSSTDHASTRRLQRALDVRGRHMQTAPWQIEVLSPSALAFTDFSDSSLRVAGTSGQATINNDYLAEQDARYRAAGWSEGRGPASGQTVYEANTAVLRLSWLHQPKLPFIAPLLKPLGNPQGSYQQRAFAAGYLPMARQITLMMQSHPVQWTDSVDGKVIYGPAEISTTAAACSGWLCGTSAPAVPFIPGPASGPDNPGLPTAPDIVGSPSPNDGNSSGAGDINGDVDPDLIVDVNDPACGVTLCCG